MDVNSINEQKELLMCSNMTNLQDGSFIVAGDFNQADLRTVLPGLPISSVGRVCFPYTEALSYSGLRFESRPGCPCCHSTPTGFF